MIRLILLLIMLATFTNVSYASFPVADTLKMKQDTVQTEAVEQYHLRMQKMGIDLNSCKCVSCRNGIAPLAKINGKVNKPFNQFKRIWLPIIITMTLLSAIVVILLFSWSNSANLPG